MFVNDALDCLGLKHGATKEEVKAAYRRLAKQSHPDAMPPGSDKARAEANFKQIAEAYSCLTAGPPHPGGVRAAAARAATRGSAARARPVRHGLTAIPFLLLVGGIVGFGGHRLVGAYNKSKAESQSHNPFLP
eukprot:jgi/Mesen1/5576/ME000281S04637